MLHDSTCKKCLPPANLETESALAVISEGAGLSGKSVRRVKGEQFLPRVMTTDSGERATTANA